MVLLRLSMNDRSGPFSTNLHLHQRLSGCASTLIDIRWSTFTNIHRFVCKYPISQYSHVPVSMLAALIASMLTEVMMPIVQMENAWLAGQVPTILPYFIIQRMLPASTLAAGILVPTRILHSSVSIRTVVYLTDMSYKSSQSLNIDPRLLLHPDLLVLYQASL